MAFALEQREIMARTIETAGVMAQNTEKISSNIVRDGVMAMQELQSAYDTYNASAKASSNYGIDVDVESSKGELNSALAELADYVQEQDLETKIGLDTDASSIEIQDKLRSLLEQGGVGEINSQLDISNVDITGGEVVQEKASAIAQQIAESINTTLSESKSALDTYLGEGNYQVELDATGNIVSVTVANTSELPEVPITAEVTEVKADYANAAPETIHAVTVTDNQVNVTATATGQEDVDSLKDSVNGVTGKDVDVKANTTGQTEVSTLKSTIDSVNGKSVTVSATTSGVEDVSSLASAISGVQSKSVSINVSANISADARKACAT